MEYKLLIGGRWVNGGDQLEVINKYTQELFAVVPIARQEEVMINETPAYRADHMPYGGNRRSGLGCEGLRFAIEEMTNIQMVAIRLES